VLQLHRLIVLLANQIKLLLNFPFLFLFLFLVVVVVVIAMAMFGAREPESATRRQHVQVEVVFESGKVISIRLQVLAMPVHQKEALFQPHLQGLLDRGKLQGILHHHDDSAAVGGCCC
jgi:hypothetical protein